jgi:hypothetical protein
MTYRLYRDGELILKGSEQDCWNYIHQHHNFSVAHALKWEGYRIERSEQ